MQDTRVVVKGRAEDSDSKTASGNRTISLDSLTMEYLRRHLEMLDEEREAFGYGYADKGKLFCHPDGRPIHPDTITRRFNKLVDRAGVPVIRLHDVRHTYATMSLDAGVDPKIVSDPSTTRTWRTRSRSTRTAQPAEIERQRSGQQR